MEVQEKEKIRTVTFLTREQIDFLDKVGKDALFYEGYKLSRAHILSDLVNILMKLGIDIKTIDLSKETFSEGLLDVINNNHCEAKKDE